MEETMEQPMKKEKKKITILGIDLWEILAYFIISVIMYVLDKIIGHTKKKKLSS